MRKLGLWKAVATVLTGGWVFGSSCVPEDFWITQLDYTLSTLVDTIISNTAVVALENVLAGGV